MAFTKPFAVRECTKADFNFDGNNEESYFYPLRRKDKLILNLIANKMLCPEQPEDLKLQGNFDSTIMQSL